MHSYLQVVLLIVIISGACPLQCYISYLISSATSRLSVDDTVTNSRQCSGASNCTCTSYLVQCPGNFTNICTTTDNQNQAKRWAYAFVDAQNCIRLPSITGVSNVTCCLSSLCNNQGFNKASTTVVASTFIWIPFLVFCHLFI